MTTTPPTPPEEKNPIQDIANLAVSLKDKFDLLVETLDKALIPEAMNNALKRVSEINKMFYEKKDDGSGEPVNAVLAMSQKELFNVRMEVMSLIEEINPAFIKGFHSYVYDHKKIKGFREFEMAKIERDRQIRAEYERQITAMATQELARLMKLPANKDKPQAEVEATARANAVQKGASVNTKSMTDREAEATANGRVILDTKVLDYLEFKENQIITAMSLISKLMDIIEGAMQYNGFYAKTAKRAS